MTSPYILVVQTNINFAHLREFHDDWAKNVTSRVHVIQLTGTIFELNSHIKETNKNAPPTGGHVFSPSWTIFKLVRDINKINVLTNFHDDWAKIVASRVFTCFHYIHIEKNAPPTGGHVFSPIPTIFKLVRDINKTFMMIGQKLKTAPPPGSHVFFTDQNHF
ncbi:hypothetical protein DPMN_052214 [Dreissena polymorpha]|uniref:Uncharacterized protein n=1 Tax=Dreissena polymorpha TaxID=45954 RepID=A0A9D4CKV0_DREPO|nr:hypothetical protein DPMN_052214 [Dreissena polymorpha]